LVPVTSRTPKRIVTAVCLGLLPILSIALWISNGFPRRFDAKDTSVSLYDSYYLFIVLVMVLLFIGFVVGIVIQSASLAINKEFSLISRSNLVKILNLKNVQNKSFLLDEHWRTETVNGFGLSVMVSAMFCCLYLGAARFSFVGFFLLPFVALIGDWFFRISQRLASELSVVVDEVSKKSTTAKTGRNE
jgi:hypothetical protein